MRRIGILSAGVVIVTGWLVSGAVGGASENHATDRVAGDELDCLDERREDFHALVHDEPGGPNTPKSAAARMLRSSAPGLTGYQIVDHGDGDPSSTRKHLALVADDGRHIGNLGVELVGDTWYLTHASMCGGDPTGLTQEGGR